MGTNDAAAREIVQQEEIRASLIRRRTAERGDAKAQCDLGVDYAEGRGVPQDYTEAVKWFREAAYQGDAFAQHALGVAYAEGRGVPQDYTEAATWYRRAAEQGDVKAQRILGVVYFRGQGVPRDLIEAYKWLNLALATTRDEKTTKFRDLIISGMTPEQIIEGSMRVAKFVVNKQGK